MSGTEKEFLEEKVQILELQCDAARERVVSLEKENEELKAQNEKMKCCENCRHNGSDSEIGENGDYTDYTCIQCDDFSTKENPYPNWRLAE